MRGFRSMASLILVRNVDGELQPKRTLAASRGFLAAARLSCTMCNYGLGLCTVSLTNGFTLLLLALWTSGLVNFVASKPYDPSLLQGYNRPMA